MKDSVPDRSPFSRLMKLWAQEVIKRIERQSTVPLIRPNADDADDDGLTIQIDSEEIQSINP